MKKMLEITVGNLDAPEEVSAEAAQEEPDEVRQPVAFETSAGEVSFEAAPQKRGRPKAEPKPKGYPEKRGRPPRPREPVPEPSVPVIEAPPLDLHALMEPLVQHYISQYQPRRENARRQRYDGLFQSRIHA